MLLHFKNQSCRILQINTGLLQIVSVLYHLAISIVCRFYEISVFRDLQNFTLEGFLFFVILQNVGITASYYSATVASNLGFLVIITCKSLLNWPTFRLAFSFNTNTNLNSVFFYWSFGEKCCRFLCIVLAWTNKIVIQHVFFLKLANQI